MKRQKLLTVLAIATVWTGIASAASLKSAATIDVAKVCDVKANGIDAVLKTAAEYNTEAKKLGVEFKRLGVTNSNYIQGTMEAAKAKQKEVTLTYKKKGKAKHQTLKTEYAAWRACHFAVRALQQVNEAESAWRMAVPGDGFTF